MTGQWPRIQVRQINFQGYLSVIPVTVRREEPTKPTLKFLRKKPLVAPGILDGVHRVIIVAMLCNVCFQMSQAILDRDLKGGDHHENLASFLNAAADGCYICEFARQRLLGSKKRDNCRVGSFKFEQLHLRDTAFVKLVMELFYGQNRHTEEVGFLDTKTQGFATTQAELIRRRQGHIPEAEAVIKIREWMGLCLRDHEGTRCWKNGTEPSSYPSRLLELGPTSFRVVRTAVERPRGPYASLSYCWGPNPAFLRLTTDNETELETGVPTSKLPLAFREAISILQGLSFEYLWIDSLCIIQSGPGSAEDWETESARMHQTYADSTLTLALACVAGPTESILNQARGQKMAAPPFVIRTNNGQQDPDADARTIMPRDYFTHALYEQPLSYRAWALQERIMATRVVSFGLSELFWDCPQLPHASESMPNGLQGTQIPMNLCQIDLVEKTVPGGSDKYALSDTWWSLLDEYTQRRLTYPKTDKLMAMSAIAHEIGKAMDDVYIAGHFWNTLPGSLNWVLEDREPSSLNRYGGRARRMFWSEKPDTQVNGQRTPSWSWASMDGPVFRWEYQRGMFPLTGKGTEAVSYKLELANQGNPTGPCLSASITIRAYCAEVEWRIRNEPFMAACTRDWDGKNIHLKVDLDEPEVRRVQGTKSLLVAITKALRPLVRQEWTGLVVEGIPHQGGNRYRRIGHFVISGVNNLKRQYRWEEHTSIFGEETRLLELF